jgi:hypothetical protein
MKDNYNCIPLISIVYHHIILLKCHISLHKSKNKFNYQIFLGPKYRRRAHTRLSLAASILALHVWVHFRLIFPLPRIAGSSLFHVTHGCYISQPTSFFASTVVGSTLSKVEFKVIANKVSFLKHLVL